MRARRLCLLTILAACASPDIEVTTAPTPGVEWAPLKKYAWQARRKTGDKRVDDEKFASMLEAAVEEQLNAKGFARDDKNPDFTLVHMVVLQRETTTQHGGSDIRGGDATSTATTPYYGSSSGRPADETYVRGILYGTLILNMFEAGKERRLWQGRAKAQLYTDNKPDRTKRRVREAVRRMLEQFPPK